MVSTSLFIRCMGSLKQIQMQSMQRDDLTAVEFCQVCNSTECLISHLRYSVNRNRDRSLLSSKTIIQRQLRVRLTIQTI